MIWDEREQGSALARAARKASGRDEHGYRRPLGKAAGKGRAPARSRRGHRPVEPTGIVGESVMLRGVPPNVEGIELQILAIMRIGGLGRADAERLLAKNSLISMHASNMGCGMALVMVSEDDMAIIAGPGYRP